MQRKQGTDELGISSAIVAPVLRALEEAGLDLARFVPAILDEVASPFVRGSVADDALNTAAEQLGDSALGIAVARRIPIGALGLLDYALCTSATVRQALSVVAAHYGVATQRVKLTLVEGTEWASLVFERHPDISHSRHWMEFSFAIIAERIRATLGAPVVFEEVAFAHAAPASAERHEAFFGRRVQFSQPQDRLTLPAALLDMPLRTASGCLASLLAERFRELEPAVDDPFLARARRAVVDLLDEGECGLVAAAARLHLSGRTLQRRLAALDTSHRNLLDEVRRERSRQLLEENGLTVADVSSRLGFSETSAFFRAFRRWTGTSPQTFRQRKTQR